ncbi:SDR family oxidoreductase [Bradyrhizobium sp. 153]|uniref:SDR family oxidoreductase n=1 Tax=Bradyrhizobium sp. 153 TaxID=2782627 RepID=UPI001FF8ED09|nr:SDR family oxidoreductase [Bradyrhizobium sp. 153]MCK1668940.1 SDR family oxidoreductase [Bradyrhizobium sp. 153]
MAAVLVTGANRGVGLALTRQYVGDGAEVIACCRDPARAEALRDLAASSAGQVRIWQLDVADEASIASLIRSLGDRPLDILINNAAIANLSVNRIEAEGWMTTLRTNALAPMLIAQGLRENLRRGFEKKLVVISSNFGSTTSAGGGSYAYRASKAALNNGMRGLSRDWAHDGILVGILHPGWVRTDMGGGEVAAVSPEESARGLIQRIAELTPATSGSFRDYRGGAIRW